MARFFKKYRIGLLTLLANTLEFVVNVLESKTFQTIIKIFLPSYFVFFIFNISSGSLHNNTSLTISIVAFVLMGLNADSFNKISWPRYFLFVLSALVFLSFPMLFPRDIMFFSILSRFITISFALNVCGFSREYIKLSLNFTRAVVLILSYTSFAIFESFSHGFVRDSVVVSLLFEPIIGYMCENYISIKPKSENTVRINKT